jgi:hypothetical protein
VWIRVHKSHTSTRCRTGRKRFSSYTKASVSQRQFRVFYHVKSFNDRQLKVLGLHGVSLCVSLPFSSLWVGAKGHGLWRNDITLSCSGCVQVHVLMPTKPRDNCPFSNRSPHNGQRDSFHYGLTWLLILWVKAAQEVLLSCFSDVTNFFRFEKAPMSTYFLNKWLHKLTHELIKAMVFFKGKCVYLYLESFWR